MASTKSRAQTRQASGERLSRYHASLAYRTAKMVGENAPVGNNGLLLQPGSLGSSHSCSGGSAGDELAAAGRQTTIVSKQQFSRNTTYSELPRKCSLPMLSQRSVDQNRSKRSSVAGSQRTFAREMSTVDSNVNQRRISLQRNERTQLCNIVEQQPVTTFDPEAVAAKYKRDYISNWLANVEYSSEKCQSPAIFPVYVDPVPSQTDTAIHIVYDG